MTLPNIFTNEFSSVSVAKLDQNFTFLENYTTGTITRAGWILQNHSNYILPLVTPRNTVPIKIVYGNGTTSTLVIPAGITSILVKMWGAGGGGGSYGAWRQGSLGGAGGYSHAIVPVVPGETITIRPGGPGLCIPGAATAFPDGGGASLSGGDNQYTGSGGGSSSIRVPSISANFCLWAGGGGGGGSVTGWGVNSGGAGGGICGYGGANTYYTSGGGQHNGGGGTQTSGGTAVAASNTTGGTGGPGLGGTHQNANCYGGGGGGGYFGGGSGSYGSSSMGGGGGGSGYIHPVLIMATTQTGNGRVPANAGDPDLSMSSSQTLQYALGGEENGYGGYGLVIIYY